MDNPTSRDMWFLGFISGIILTLIVGILGLGLPDVGGSTYTSRNILVLQSKYMFAVTMTFLISVIVYGFVEGKPVYSGFIDGVSAFLIFSSYISLIVAGYTPEYPLPLLLAISNSRSHMLIFDWGQVGILTLTYKNRKKLLKLVSLKNRTRTY